jgi:transcriptional regulator with XRE-family HTH domain
MRVRDTGSVPNRSNKAFVEELPNLVRERKMSLRTLAQLADVNPSHLSRVLRRADYKTPSADLVRRIAVALGLPHDYFPEFREAIVHEQVKLDAKLRDELYDRLRRRKH